MSGLEKILAATDLSAPSRHAVDRAFQLAVDTGAALTLVHALSQSALDELRAMFGQQAEPVAQQVKDAARQALDALAADPERSKGVSASTHLAYGAALQAVLEHADTVDADLLIVGDRGENFLRHILLGSTASRLLRKSLRPVLVVKQQAHESYRCVLLPVDLSPASVMAIELARKLAPQARLILMHAFELPFEGKLSFAGVEDKIIRQYRAGEHAKAMEALQELAKQAGLSSDKATLVVRPGNPAQQILEQEEVQDCDLIIMGKHNQYSVEELLLGSVTKHVLTESRGDILVFATR